MCILSPYSQLESRLEVSDLLLVDGIKATNVRVTCVKGVSYSMKFNEYFPRKILSLITYKNTLGEVSIITLPPRSKTRIFSNNIEY